MKKAVLLTENSTAHPDTIKKLVSMLEDRKLEVRVLDVPSLPVGSINPTKFDTVIAYLPTGHTKLPTLTEAVMAVIAGSPMTRVKGLVTTYSGQVGLSFHKYRPDKQYEPQMGVAQSAPFFGRRKLRSDNLAPK